MYSHIIYHLHAFFLHKIQRKLRMSYINLPSLWNALPFIEMVKTPFAKNNQTWFLCTGILQTNINSLKKMEIHVSVAKKDAVISYKCSHQAYLV